MGSGSRSLSDEVGYNKANVEAIRDDINNWAKQAATKIVESIHDEIVVKVAELWYSEAAVNYFTEFASTLKNKEEDITRVFQNFNEKMRIAGENWAEATEATDGVPNMPAIDQVDLSLDISSIKPMDDKGDRFITLGIEGQVNNFVSEARYKIQSYIEEQVSVADASLAFFGGGQENAIQTAAGELDDQVNEILLYLSEGPDSIVEATHQKETTYSETASENNTNWSDSNFSNLS